MDCGTSMAKYILFIFNSIVTVIGILGIVYGVFLLQSIGMITVDSQTGYPPQAAFPLGLIVLSSLVVFIAFLGCCGAIRESVCMTMCYAILMLIILIIQLTIVILLFTHKDQLYDGVSKMLNEVWDMRQRDPTAFEFIQQTFHCCGKTGFTDYPILSLPASCCSGSCSNPLNIYGGCQGVIKEVISGGTETAKYAGLGLIVVELVGFIFGCCLANNVRNYKRRNAY